MKLYVKQGGRKHKYSRKNFDKILTNERKPILSRVALFLLLDLCGGEFQGAVLLLGDNKYLTDKAVVCVIENARGIERTATNSRLEMKMVACRTARVALQTHGIACLQPLSHFDQIARMMAIHRLQAVCVTKDDAVSVGIVRARQNDFARECSSGCVACKCLQVSSTMMPRTAIRTAHLGSRKRIAPLLDCIIGEVYRELVVIGKGVFCRFHTHYLPLVDIRRFVLSENH